MTLKHLVLKSFIDKESGELHLPASLFISEDYTRVESLHELGFLLPNPNTETLKKPTQKKGSTRQKKVSDHDVGESTESTKDNK